MKNKKIRYEAKGIVLGNYWGGGAGYYASETLNAKTYKTIVNQINKGIKDGSLDAGMGYESLIGAIMEITKITEIVINEKTFINKESSIDFFSIPEEFEKEAEDVLLNYF